MVKLKVMRRNDNRLEVLERRNEGRRTVKEVK
jgi:hypothetical protein